MKPLLTYVLCSLGCCLVFTNAQDLQVIAPPESFFEKVRERDREAARAFYEKYLDVNGIPVAAAGVVADQALFRTHEIVSHMLAGRPDIVQTMIERNMYLIIIGKDQLYTDMPENRNRRNKDYLNERVRGTGGNPTSFGEENLLSLPLDRYDDESIGVHEFCHTIDNALRTLDGKWLLARDAAYRHAMEKGLYKYAYAASNPGEYWAEIAQSYFDSNRVNNYNHGPIGTREQLAVYDPEGYELARKVFRLQPDQDWRYTYLQKHPIVTTPPAKFQIDPYYTKFSWAREFTVLGRNARDEALLKTNRIIRRMFAYRHDILKALINDGARLVVLGKDEALADLPELESRDVDLLVRFHDYDPVSKLIVIDETNVLADPQAAMIGQSQVVRGMAKAFFTLTSERPVDPNWENRGRDVQQYELRVKRLDETFGKKVEELFDAASDKGLWKGTAAVHSPAEYWAQGVAAYLDAVGHGGAPNSGFTTIATREALAGHDPDLYELVKETMAFEGRVDWRLSNGEL